MADNYKVDKIREAIKINEAGDAVKIFKVRAIGPGNTTFTVDFPEVEFTDAQVATVLSQHAANIAKILKQ